MQLLALRRRAAAVSAVVLAFAVAVPLTQAAQAHADTAPVAPVTVPTVSADVLPTVQIDGVAWAEVVVGTRVYVTGKFSNARPAGAAAGTNQTARSNILAFDLTTGALVTSWAPTLNAQGLAIAASGDGTKIYVAGDFTSVNGVAKNRVVALDAATGAIVPGFNASVSSQARALAVIGNTLYVGGSFSSAAGQARQRLAAFNATTGALLSWAPAVDQGVMTMTAVAGLNEVVVGGHFTTMNGAAALGMAAVDGTTGASLPWAVNQIVQDYGADAAIYSLTNDGTKVYGTGYGYLIHNDPTTNANLESVFAANASGGAMVWVSGCRGDTYSAGVTNGVVYNVGHAHDCSTIGGHPQTNPWTYQRALAFNAAPAADGRLNNGGSFNGQPAPELLHWYPTLAAGTVTGQGQAAWSVGGTKDYVVLGGEFPTVNGVAQQGLVRFAVKTVAPNKEGPQGSAELKPTLTPIAPGVVRVAWTAAYDRDNQQLTYDVLRGGTVASSTVLTTQTKNSSFFNRPPMALSDRGATPGSSQTYRVRVKDAFGNTVTSSAVTITVPAGTAAASPYADAVTADSPDSYWRLGEAGGTTAYDWASGNDMTLASDTQRGVTGALSGDSDAASAFSGVATVPGTTAVALPGPQTFSVEAWFKTTSTSGGKIVGFGNSNTADSNSYDRHLYLTNNGNVVFGVYNNTTSTLTSGAGFNDGKWHQVVGTLGAGGMTLYVDGKKLAARSDATFAQSYSGYWRIGGDTLNGWPNQPAGNKLAGTVDEVAVYPTVLGADRVAAHYTAAGGTVVLPQRPADAYGKAVWDSGPDLYLRLDETAGSSALNTMTADTGATYDANVQLGRSPSPAAPAGKAITFPGNAASTVVASALTSNPQVFSLEAWFSTTTTKGGRIIGFGNAASGPSSNYDRHLYMLDTGRLRYGIWTGQTSTIDSPNAYNDGAWHHVVVTQGPGGQQMFVDGALVATGTAVTPQGYDGYWRLGSDNTWGGATSNDFAGSVDEAAVYSSVLSASTVQAHYQEGQPAVNKPPTATFTSTPANLQVAFDGSASSDAAGTVVSYAWDFGDGTTGSGTTVSHTYASANTYSVKLTVTDDKGATGSVTNPVTVTAPTANVLAADTFSRSVTNGWGTADSGGAWTVSGTASNFNVANGVGTIRMGSAGAGPSAAMSTVSAGAADVMVTVSADKAGTGNGVYFGVVGRRTSGGDYRAKLRMKSDNTLGIAFTKVVSGTETAIGSEVTLSGVTYAAGDRFTIRFQLDGSGTTNLRLKVWRAGGTEPAAWQLTQTDSTAVLQGTGSVGLLTYLSGSATNAPVTASFDDLRVTAL